MYILHHKDVLTVPHHRPRMPRSLPEVHPLVVAVLPAGHVPVVPDDLPHVLRRHIFLLSLHEPKLPLLAVALRLELLPFLSYKQRTEQAVRRTRNDSVGRTHEADLSPVALPPREACRLGKEPAASQGEEPGRWPFPPLRTIIVQDPPDQQCPLQRHACNNTQGLNLSRCLYQSSAMLSYKFHYVATTSHMFGVQTRVRSKSGQ